MRRLALWTLDDWPKVPRVLVIHGRKRKARCITQDGSGVARRLQANHHIFSRAIGTGAGEVAVGAGGGIELVVVGTRGSGRSGGRERVAALAVSAAVRRDVVS